MQGALIRLRLALELVILAERNHGSMSGQNGKKMLRLGFVWFAGRFLLNRVRFAVRRVSKKIVYGCERTITKGNPSMKIKCKRFEAYPDVHFDEHRVGAFFWLPKEERAEPEYELMLIWLPDGVARLHCHTDPFISRTPNFWTVWHWDGNRDEPTLSPSINNPPAGWHGFLRAGYLESV